MTQMKTADVRSHPDVVPRTHDRALTDVLRARRMVGETDRRLTEALEILLKLEEWTSTESIDRASWARGLDDAIRKLTSIRTLLAPLLAEERR
jgi:hypothetical protein